MKTILFALLLAATAAASKAAMADFVVSFDPPVPQDPTIEYVVELKQPDGSFIEVAKGPTSPIAYSANASWGTYAVRIFTRTLPTAGFVRNIELDTSVETSTYLVPGKPTNPRVISNRSLKP